MTERRPGRLRVTIAAITYRRPDDLAELLPLLMQQRRHAETEHDVEVDVLIIDNDPDETARPVVASSMHSAIRYVSEPIPGIAAARNRALHKSSASDILVFIDDDERPVDEWLTSLLTVYLDSRPAGVVGPVVSEFAVPPSEWIDAGAFFDRRRHPTGSRVSVAATNNLLLDLHEVRTLGLEFDGAFGLSGGSDTLFTRQITSSGRSLIWCAEAMVIDIVPAGRLTPTWVLQRARRSGNSHSRVEVMLAASVPDRVVKRCRLTAEGALRVTAGSVRHAVGILCRSTRHRAKGARTVRRGLGMISGAWGRVVVEYGRA